MVFDGYQDGYNGSHIIYSNGTGKAFMNVHVVLDSYRFITFLHLKLCLLKKSSLLPWEPNWISESNDSSNSEFPCCS